LLQQYKNKMDLNLENLNLIESTEDESESEFEDEDDGGGGNGCDGNEDESDEDDDSRVFFLDQLAPKIAKEIFKSQIDIDIQESDDDDGDDGGDDGDDGDDESHILDNTDGDFFIIPSSKPTKLSPCVVIDNYNSSGGISRCCSIEKLVPLAQLFGTWEVDVSVEDNSDFKLYEYGVCTSHFNFDNSKLHNPNDKKKKYR
jgi:hypothetical protein